MSSSTADNTCPVCLEEIPKMMLCRVVPCGHNYCYLCLKLWCLNKEDPTCPFCRQIVKNVYCFNKRDSRFLIMKTRDFKFQDKMEDVYQIGKKMINFIKFLIENIFTQCKSNFDFLKSFVESQRNHSEKMKNENIQILVNRWKEKYFSEVLNYQYKWSEIKEDFEDIMEDDERVRENLWDEGFDLRSIEFLKKMTTNLFNYSNFNKEMIERIWRNLNEKDLREICSYKVSYNSLYIKVNKRETLGMIDGIIYQMYETKHSLYNFIRMYSMNLNDENLYKDLEDLYENCVVFLNKTKNYIEISE